MSTIEINIDRILYLMELFGLDKPNLLLLIKNNKEKRKKILTEQDIFVRSIEESYLKEVDKIFDKGLSFYTDTTPPPRNKSSSIFFRKNEFNSTLELGDRELVHKMECRIHSLSALCKLANHTIKRKIKKIYTPNDNPVLVAQEIREKLYPKPNSEKKEKIKGDRDFLKALIESFAQYNILVLEFVETWNKKNTTNLNGFFIAPNYIIIKREQKNFKREIFTLLHELGHYLLNQEEIYNIESEPKNLTDIERWCDRFAFAFLEGNAKFYTNPKINPKTIAIDDKELLSISQKFHISRLALFTHWVTEKIITWNKYEELKENLNTEYQNKQEKKEYEKQKNKALEKKSRGFPSQPISSSLEKDIYVSAYFEGVIDEYRVLTELKAKDLDEVLYK